MEELNPEAVKKILVIKLNALGDVLMTTPAISGIRKAFPEAKIFCLVPANAVPLLENNPDVDGIIPLDLLALRKKGRLSRFLEILSSAIQIRKMKFDAVFDFSGTMWAAWITGLSHAQYRIGFIYPHRWFCYNIGVHPEMARRGKNMTVRKVGEMVMYGDRNFHDMVKGFDHEVDHMLRLISQVGIEPTIPSKIMLHLTPEESEKAKRWLAECGLDGTTYPIIGINLGASNAKRNWGEDKFVLLAKRLLENFNVVFIYGPMDKVTFKDRVDQFKSKNRKAVLIPDQSTLRETSAIISRCAVFVTCDTLCLHMASGLGVPTVALFGPTSPVLYCPYGVENRIIYTGIPCSPCFGYKCENNLCMQEIIIEEVERAIYSLLEPATVK